MPDRPTVPPLADTRRRVSEKRETAAPTLAIALILFAPNAFSQKAFAADLQSTDCETYARSYADAHVTGDPADLSVADGAMRGAVIGEAWQGPGGARRGAVAGGAVSVLDSLGNYPAGWRGLYDMAYRMCRNAQSPVSHRPSTLGDPSYRPSPQQHREIVPPLPAPPRSPIRP
ncbi:hypothetical protein FMN50_09285 [Rhodobacterales bacterium]|nr:hypothetical protein FMN50_09285 [Rhodobacterales bacterium]